MTWQYITALIFNAILIAIVVATVVSVRIRVLDALEKHDDNARWLIARIDSAESDKPSEAALIAKYTALCNSMLETRRTHDTFLLERNKIVTFEKETERTKEMVLNIDDYTLLLQKEYDEAARRLAVVKQQLGIED